MAVSGKEQLCHQLLEFPQEEKIYQKYYELQNDPAARSAYLAQNEDYVREKCMLIPELSDIYIPEDFSEQTYYSHLPLSRGSNVNIVRHLRYTPVFCYVHLSSRFSISCMVAPTIRWQIENVCCLEVMCYSFRRE